MKIKPKKQIHLSPFGFKTKGSKENGSISSLEHLDMYFEEITL